MLKAKGSTIWDAKESAFWEASLGFLKARKGKRIANWRNHPKLANSLYRKWFLWPISCLARGSPIWRAPRRRIAAWTALAGKERRFALPGLLLKGKWRRIANWRDHPKLANSLYKKWFFWRFSGLARESPIWRAPRRRTAAWRVLEGKERRIVLPGLLLKGKWRRIALPGLLKNVPQKEYPFGGHREHHLGSQMKYPLGVLTICQSDWSDPQNCQFLSLKSDYFDNFSVWLEGAPDLSISFFKKSLFWQVSCLTGWSLDWREPQICQFLSLKSDYFDNLPVWLERAPDLSISFFKKWLFWQFSSRTGIGKTL